MYFLVNFVGVLDGVNVVNYYGDVVMCEVFDWWYIFKLLMVGVNVIGYSVLKVFVIMMIGFIDFVNEWWFGFCVVNFLCVMIGSIDIFKDVLVDCCIVVDLRYGNCYYGCICGCICFCDCCSLGGWIVLSDVLWWF